MAEPTEDGNRSVPHVLQGPNRPAVDFLQTTSCRMIAEIGVSKGYTSEEFAKFLNGEGELHLFDYSSYVFEVSKKLESLGYTNIVAHANSWKAMDSYNWSLMRLLQKHSKPLFDYVFLDGAHTWPVDALAFFLIDRLLVPGGFIQFDDYDWSLAKSPTMNPGIHPQTALQFTDEQIQECHVRLIVELLVRTDCHYVEVVKNRVFQKAITARS